MWEAGWGQRSPTGLGPPPPGDQGLASKEGSRRPGCVCSDSPGPSTGPAGHTEGARINTFELSWRSLKKTRTNLREQAGDKLACQRGQGGRQSAIKNI